MANEPTLLTLPEAAEILRMEQRPLLRAAKRGRIPGAIELPGGAWRFNREALIAWILTATQPEGGRS